ncbi:MAG: hypothetical protein KDC67_14170 [Ignavibacteriae bacterium]|nr:hypothetical protein [Ignavibacteriota bacterium]
MALIKCRDCEKDISSDLVQCIHCGAIQQDEFRKANELNLKIMTRASDIAQGLISKIFK